MEEQIPQEAEENPIEFFTEDIDFELLDASILSNWIVNIILQEKKKLQQISYIFCSDAYLHDLNVQYLDHDTLTDVITFQYTELPHISGDIFISLERVQENAKIFNNRFEDELHRVMIHGVLHLCGYHDKSPDDKMQMTTKENQALEYLSLLLSEKNNTPQG